MPNINKNIIKQAGAAVANATNKAAGLSASTPEPGTIISAIQLVNGGRKIGPADVVHFTESVRNKLLSLLVSMEPIQDFHGYDRPWPAGGGKNKLPYTTLQSQTVNGTTFTVNDDGSITISGTPSTQTRVTVKSGLFWDADVVETFSSGTMPNGIRFFSERLRGGRTSYPTLSPTATAQVGDEYRNLLLEVNTTFDGTAFTVYPMIEAGSTATAWTPYSNICPFSGRRGAVAYVSPTPNVADATTYAADWTTPAGTVCAGSADIVTGDIKVAPYYESYNGETLVGPWISSMDEYDPDGTPTTGAQVVDLGGTMTEYHITGQDIITLVGDNYIWSDSGDVTITE